MEQLGQAARDAQQSAALMEQVRALGRIPKEHAPSEDPEREAERRLAHDLRKARAAALLEPADEEELQALQRRGAEQDKEQEAARVASMAEDAYAALETTGKLDRALLTRLRRASRGLQLHAETRALLDEIQWRLVREDEAAKAEVRARRRRR